jgi:hypothetical protein
METNIKTNVQTYKRTNVQKKYKAIDDTPTLPYKNINNIPPT